eukprot:CAMPEP_0202971846 /NCGR_PEP_ID=MMETSP1396-20130829/31469_1 /ASSEMBLY_ACC=CAM_ASM_000872 /TAXON_ID= /ORGANISM="Pseudokeronopsis sp., Strain Brazil" /LENGTH=71 /DNA_ID=CAMNT_0049701673 /DNA_START=751 /DNA_END=966 /DNA_ORIENTATION=+
MRKDLQTTKDKKQNDSPKNFDNMGLSGENAVSQLIIINQTVQKFAMLKEVLDRNEKIKEEKKKKIENFEIV